MCKIFSWGFSLFPRLPEKSNFALRNSFFFHVTCHIHRTCNTAKRPDLFFGYFKSSHIVDKRALPLWDPWPLWGRAGLTARRFAKFVGAVWNRTHQNVEVYGRSEDETQRKCILQAEKHYAWVKKTLRRTFISLGKTVFSPFGRKKQPFFLEK